MTTIALGRIRSRTASLDAAWLVTAGLGLGWGILYWITMDAGGETTFPALAQAFLDGHLSIPWAENRELIPVGDRGYVPLPPVPALIHLPFVALGLVGPQPLAVAMSAGSVMLAHRLLTAMETQLLPATLIVMGFASSTLWYVTVTAGRMWQFAHVTGVLFALAALLVAWKGRSPLAAGILLGLAAGSRLPMGLMLPVLIYLYREQSWRAWLPLVGGVAVVAVPIAAYNVARFGSPVEFGHNLIPSTLCALGTIHCQPWYSEGVLSLSYIPRSLGAALFAGFHISSQAPYLLASGSSLSLAITAPIYLLALAVSGSSRLALGIGAVALLVMLPNLAHGAWGFWQYGYRFILDAAPLLVMLLGVAYRERATPALWLVVGGGAAATLYGFYQLRIMQVLP